MPLEARVDHLAPAVGEQAWRHGRERGRASLVLFSYLFLLQGFTGLVVATGSVATLAILMYLTAGIDWYRVFARRVPSGPEDDADTTATESLA